MHRAKMTAPSLRLGVSDVHMDIKRAIPCGLIITELISNSLKHAFPNGKKGEIVVEMYPDKGEKYKLVISDNGVGFPEGLDFRQTKSLGMRLVVDLVNQLNGTIELRREKGTEFRIEF
jgi:two-component sensor histidine kinase